MVIAHKVELTFGFLYSVIEQLTPKFHRALCTCIPLPSHSKSPGYVFTWWQVITVAVKLVNCLYKLFYVPGKHQATVDTWCLHTPDLGRGSFGKNTHFSQEVDHTLQSISMWVTCVEKSVQARIKVRQCYKPLMVYLRITKKHAQTPRTKLHVYVHVQTTYIKWAGLLGRPDASLVLRAWERGYLV